MRRASLAIATAAALTITAFSGPVSADSHVVTAEPGQDVNIFLLPKFLGITPFDQANRGATEAEAELQNPTEHTYNAPATITESVAGQIELMTNAPVQGFDVVLLSNNAGDQIAPAAEAAQEGGTNVVTWDSPIPSALGETVFVAQVDFNEMGVTMAEMAHSIMGPEGGQVAILSASPDATNQNIWNSAFIRALATDPRFENIQLVDYVYGNDSSEESYNQALSLIDQYPDLKVIMAPTTVAIAAAAKAVQDNELCDQVKVSGLGLPDEMVDFTLAGCAPEFALWDFVDLGYLAYYVGYLIGSGQLEGVEGETFQIGRPIKVNDQDTFTIEKDPTREAGLRVLMGPFTVYDAENVEAAVG